MSAQKHKIVLVLCVVTWAGIFFLSGTLFVGKRYDIGMANKLVSKLSSSLQEQIDNLSSEVNEGKSSALDLTRALHKKINLTLSTLDNKISALEKEFAEKRQLALHALNALHHGTSDTKDEKSGEHSRTLEARGPVEIKSSASQTCIDSMEQSVGSDVELFECHGLERNQAWRHHDSNRLIENKAIDMCLRADGGSDGSPVKTASCDENDPQQKWIRSRLSFILDDGAQGSKCLATDSENRKLVVKLCESTKESQHWTY